MLRAWVRASRSLSASAPALATAVDFSIELNATVAEIATIAVATIISSNEKPLLSIGQRPPDANRVVVIGLRSAAPAASPQPIGNAACTREWVRGRAHGL